MFRRIRRISVYVYKNKKNKESMLRRIRRIREVFV